MTLLKKGAKLGWRQNVTRAVEGPALFKSYANSFCACDHKIFVRVTFSGIRRHISSQNFGSFKDDPHVMNALSKSPDRFSTERHLRMLGVAIDPLNS